MHNVLIQQPEKTCDEWLCLFDRGSLLRNVSHNILQSKIIEVKFLQKFMYYNIAVSCSTQEMISKSYQ